LLERLTWGFVVAIMVFSLVLSTNLVTPTFSGSNDILERAGEQTTPFTQPPADLDGGTGIVEGDSN
jgi:hypothetical protein